MHTLDEFAAHVGNVNCLALGHKSGRVMVSGGDDKKVNMWAVGKPACIMVSGYLNRKSKYSESRLLSVAALICVNKDVRDSHFFLHATQSGN